jgi:alpha-beta hydrolase superfamily lysophospholipase
MAHGFGAERAFQLPADADRFVDRGVAALLFDYRGFGDSEGPTSGSTRSATGPTGSQPSTATGSDWGARRSAAATSSRRRRDATSTPSARRPPSSTESRR